jgi:hypothetical protein
MPRNIKSERKPPMKIVSKKPGRWKTAQKPPPDPLRTTATHVVNFLEEMVSIGAIRLPYPGFLEALVDLKRALSK